MAGMVIVYEDESYVLDMEEVTVKQAETVQNATGYTLANLDEALEQADAKALIAIYWLMQVTNGHAVHIQQVDFKIVKFANALQEAWDRKKDEDAAEEAATKRSGKTKRVEAPKAQTHD